MYNYRQIDADDLEYVTVARVDELGNGDRILIEIGERVIAVFNVAGQYFAIADLCSHDDGPVAEGEVHDHEIECPRHGARFDLRTGKALSLPAVVDIPAYPVRVQGNEVQVGVPREGE